ncbi:hypothetical protein OIM90_00290 [Streptomyces sp. AD16]|nr:hypothetical protein OIM90_00290 [Streptomyces sp. AD16]
MLSRVIHGARVSLLVGAGAALLAGVIGTAVGLAAGYFGGWADRTLMRLADVQLAFPRCCWPWPSWASSAPACGWWSWCSASPAGSPTPGSCAPR